MAGMSELMREYERARFPEHRRLDVHAEGPKSARDRVLRWIQSRAHEEPGQELLLVVERGGRPGRAPSAVAAEVQKLLAELDGKLIEWWQPFAPGSLAVRVSPAPTVLEHPSPPSLEPGDEGRTAETAGAAGLDPRADIPSELLERAVRAAEMRIDREGHSIRLLDVVLREIWIEVQALAMEKRLSFEAALERTLRQEAVRIQAEPT